MTKAQAIDDAAYRLRKLLATEGAELAQAQPWLWEFDRWKELIFALLAQISAIPQTEIRLLVDQMVDLDLLDIHTLSSIDSDTTAGQHLTELMLEAGIEEDLAPAALTTLAEAARGLQQAYDGKIQKYLRRYAELMLREISDSFQFTMMKPDDVADAFTYWLQNVAQMPLSLVDESVRSFCSRYGFTPGDLIEGADLIDMNLAVVDDLVQVHVLHWPEDAGDEGDADGA